MFHVEQFKKDQCPVCGSKDISPSFKTKDYMITQEEFSIDKCSSCGFLFTNPVPQEEVIGR